MTCDNETKIRADQLAADNPWYALATVFGEQTEAWWDDDLHEQNRRIWNGWSCSKLSAAERDEIAMAIQLDPADLAPLTEAEWGLLETRFAALGKPVPQAHPMKSFKTLLFRDQGRRPTDIALSFTHFNKPLLMRQFVFFGDVHIEYSSFDCPVDFSLSYFNESLIFEFSEISGKCSFHSSCIKDYTNFSCTKFFGEVNFDQAKMLGNSTFDGAQFCRSGSFRQVSFNGYTNFRGNFLKDCNFSEANFHDSAQFEHAVFEGECSFDFANFERGALFEDSKFPKTEATASFKGAKFGADARFHRAEFEGGAEFSEASFDGFAYWPKVKFAKAVTFSDCHFNRPTSFARAHFETKFPALDNTTLHPTTTFTADDHHWPTTTASTAEKDRDSLKVMRHALSKQGLPEEEHYFFRREMRANSLIGPWWLTRPYWAFGFFANHGHSIARPLFWLAALWLAGVFFFFNFAGDCCRSIDDFICYGEELSRAKYFSFANIFSFLGIHRIYFDASTFYGMSMLQKWFAGLQAILGVFFLFLLGLGLRTRFRLR